MDKSWLFCTGCGGSVRTGGVVKMGTCDLERFRHNGARCASISPLHSVTFLFAKVSVEERLETPNSQLNRLSKICNGSPQTKENSHTAAWLLVLDRKS